MNRNNQRGMQRPTRNNTGNKPFVSGGVISNFTGGVIPAPIPSITPIKTEEIPSPPPAPTLLTVSQSISLFSFTFYYFRILSLSIEIRKK